MTPSDVFFPSADGAGSAPTEAFAGAGSASADAAAPIGAGGSPAVYVLHGLLIKPEEGYTVAPEFCDKLLSIALENNLAYVANNCAQMQANGYRGFLFKKVYSKYSGILRASSPAEMMEMAKAIDVYLREENTAGERILRTRRGVKVKFEDAVAVDDDARPADCKRPLGAPRFFNPALSSGAGGGGSAAPAIPLKLTLPSLAGVGFSVYVEQGPAAAASENSESESNLTSIAHIEYLREKISAYIYIAPGVFAIGPEAPLLARADGNWDKYAIDTQRARRGLTPKLTTGQHIILIKKTIRDYLKLINLTDDRPCLRTVFEGDLKEAQDELVYVSKSSVEVADEVVVKALLGCKAVQNATWPESPVPAGPK